MRRLNSSLAAAVLLFAIGNGAAIAQELSREEGISTAPASSRGLPAFSLGSSVTLARSTIDSGGAEVLGGGLRLTATVGQPEVGIVTDGGLRLTAGFHGPILSAGPEEDRIFSDRFSSDP